MENTIVNFYIQSSCSSSRKALQWLDENRVNYKIVHLIREGMPKEQLITVLLHTENGFEDIIKKGHFSEEMQEMSFNQLIDHLLKNPTKIKSPIMIQGKNKVFIGFNEEEMGTFLPRRFKYQKMKKETIAI